MAPSSNGAEAKMNELQALILGIVQGLTEFLPISSSGHLVIVPWLMDFTYLNEHPAFNKTFDVAVHMGTLIALLAYFRSTIYQLSVSFARSIKKRSIESEPERLAWLIIAATVPAAIAGALGESFIEKELGEPWQIAFFMAAFGLLLWAADRLPQREELGQLTLSQAIVVGLAQVLSLAPGVSRSGITITAGRFVGLSRDAAARFSFLLLGPVVFGAGLFKGVDVVRDGLPAGATSPFIIGILSAAVSGLFAIWGLLKLVRRHSYNIFVWYRLAAAAAISIVLALGIR